LSKLGRLISGNRELAPARQFVEEEGGGDGDGDGDGDDDGGGVEDGSPRRQDLLRSREDPGCDGLVEPSS
jgi:hypothetical protein